MDNALNEINEKLDIIIALMIPPYSVDNYEIKGETQLSVLKFCDLNYTQDEIAKKLNKTKKSISRAIEKLILSNLIKSIKKDDEVVYLRLK